MKLPKATVKKKICNNRARARQFLFSDGNYITLVLAVLISASAAVLSYMLAALVLEFTYSWVSTAMLLLLEFLVFAPMALGTVRVAVALYMGGENPLSELFFAFSSYGTYIKALILVLIQVLKTALVIGSAAGTFLLISGTLSWYLPYLTVFWNIIAAITAVGVL